MTKSFKCLVCGNFTVHRYLGRWVHQSCFDYIETLIYRKFGVIDHDRVMEKLSIMRNWEPEGFIDVDQLYSVLCIINQTVETVKEP